MAFTTNCFIRKNTPELRKKLEELGYDKRKDQFPLEDPYLRCVIVNGTYYYCAYDARIAARWSNVTINEPAIDCDENEDLFLALAALRDDSDYRQWFTCKVKDGNGEELPDSWFLCDEKTLQEFASKNHSPNSYSVYHKATVLELIEYFNNKLYA